MEGVLQLETCCGAHLLGNKNRGSSKTVPPYSIYGSTQMSETIDVSRVERELVDALAADRKYARENDAKIRAVSQRVATYEEFR